LPIGCFAYLAKKTGFLVALIATVFQLVFAPLALVALVIVVTARSSSVRRGQFPASGSSSSSGGSKSHAPTATSYAVQRLLPTHAQWTGTNYPRGTMSGAVHFADKLKAKEPTLAIRVVEIKDGKEGSTVYSA